MPEQTPAWARELTEKYYSRTISTFVLTGNVHDVQPLDGAYVTLPKFLESALFGKRDILIRYDRGGGLAFGSPEMEGDFRKFLEGYDERHRTAFSHGLPRSPDSVLTILESYLRVRLLVDHKKVAIVIDYAETIVPAGDTGSLSAEDRNSLVILKRWAQNPMFLRADATIVLIAENLSELNQGIVQNPGVDAVSIALPDEADRAEFVRKQLAATPLPEGSDATAETIAKLAAGLRRVQLQHMLSHAHENRQPLTVKFLSARKKELIEAESGGLLEFVQSKYDLSFVAGNDAAKQKLRDAAAALRIGRTDVLPMGYVICGPVGTGKSFMTTCFAGEVGIPAVVLKNFRSMWQGQTEGNLERVLTLLRAMSPIAVIVDEADAQLGDRDNSGDSGVGNRVFAQIAQFMGNTENRGKVIWFLLTCRPDLLPVDLKRQGRAEEHIALFYPDTDDERLAMLRAMRKKTGTDFASDEVEQVFLKRCTQMSGADIEAVLVRSKMRAALRGGSSVEAADLIAALEDFIPPAYPEEIELQIMAAVMECTSRSLLPKVYREMARAELMDRAMRAGLQ